MAGRKSYVASHTLCLGTPRQRKEGYKYRHQAACLRNTPASPRLDTYHTSIPRNWSAGGSYGQLVTHIPPSHRESQDWLSDGISTYRTPACHYYTYRIPLSDALTLPVEFPIPASPPITHVPPSQSSPPTKKHPPQRLTQTASDQERDKETKQNKTKQARRFATLHASRKHTLPFRRVNRVGRDRKLLAWLQDHMLVEVRWVRMLSN